MLVTTVQRLQLMDMKMKCLYMQTILNRPAVFLENNYTILKKYRKWSYVLNALKNIGVGFDAKEFRS